MKMRFIDPEKPRVVSLKALFFAVLDKVNHDSPTVQMETGGTGPAE